MLMNKTKHRARTIKVVSDAILEWNPSVGVESAMELTFSILEALERSQKDELREIVRGVIGERKSC